MKKAIINILLLCFCILLFSQSVMPTDGVYTNWDWEYQGQANWKRKNGNIWEEIPPPFNATTNRSYDIVKVYETADYTRDKGWSLIFANFNNVYPYFILYNSHLSIVRAFFYLDFNESFTHILATLEFDGNNANYPGILTFGRGNHGFAADKYFTTNRGDNDIISVVFPLAPQSWASADFPITFDPYIQNNRYNSRKWIFSFWGCLNNTLRLQGEIASGSSLQIAQNTLISQKNALTYNAQTNKTSYNGQAAQFNKKVDSFASLINQLKSTTSTISSADSITVNGTKQRNVLQSYKKEVESIANMSTFFKVILGVTNFFSGVFDESKPSSSASTVQVLNLEGSMTLQQLLRTNTLKIPGVNGVFFPYVDWEPFDCVMGIANLRISPKITMTTAYERYKFYEDYTMWKHIDSPQEYFGKFVQCKFDDNLNFAINNINGLNMLDVKGALLFRITGAEGTILDVTKRFIKHRIVFTTGQSAMINVENPVYAALDKGLFKIYKYEKKRNGNINVLDYIIGTPMLPINQIKGLSMEVPENSDVFLRIQANFQSDKYENDIIFQRDYSMDTIRVNANKSKSYAEQTNFPSSDYYTNEPQIVLSTTTNGSYSAGQIILKPGFVGKARNLTLFGQTHHIGFKATAVYIYPINGNTVFNHYDFYCDYSPPQNAPRKNTDSVIIDSNAEIQISPNPNNGLFYISSENNIASVKIFDMLGRIVYQQNNFNNNFAEIKINNNFAAGIYIVQLVMESKETYSQKIVLNH